MKGPLQRIHYDVRRIWQCPLCNRNVKTAGTVVFKRCNCKPEGVWMQIHTRPERKFAIHDTYTIEEPEPEETVSEELAKTKEFVVESNVKSPESSETNATVQQPDPPQENTTTISDNKKSSETSQKEIPQKDEDVETGFDSGIFED